MENSTNNHQEVHKLPRWHGLRHTRAMLALRSGARRSEVRRCALLPCRVPTRARVRELVFAAVRPGFVAACMVEATGSRAGLREHVHLSVRRGPVSACGRRGMAARRGRTPVHREWGGGARIAGSAGRFRGACDSRSSGVGIGHHSAPAETDIWHIGSRLRQAFEEVFGAVLLSHRESARPPRGRYWLLWVTRWALRVIYLNLW
jgi:hypothetical protein